MKEDTTTPANGPKLNRRKFLQQSGHLLIGFSMFPMVMCKNGSEDGDQTDEESTLPGSLKDNAAIHGWIRLDTAGTVTVLTGKMEIGQGIRTALLQMAAEELDVSMGRMQLIMADTAQTADERYTSGSASIESSGKAIRNAAAEARHQLLKLGEVHLGVPAAQLVVADGIVQVQGNRQQKVSYWQLLKGKKLEGEVTGNAALKDPAHYKIVGMPVHRKDILAMATGDEVYVQDLRLPNMVHARVLRPAGYEAKLKSLPESKVKALPGLLALVQDGNFVAVIAEKEFQAVKAHQLLQQEAIWEAGAPLPDQNRLFEEMLRHREDGNAVEDNPDTQNVINNAAAKVEATYTRPYQMHASIGPSCAIASWENDKLTIWTHSQGVYPLKKTVADMLAIPEDNIRAIGVAGSGCYGHNGADDVAADAALLARAYPGRPVRVQWMREDEHRWEPYGSAMLFKMRGGLDGQGNIVGWETQLWSDSHSTRPGGDAGNLLPARHIAKAFKLNDGGYSGGNHRNAKPLYALPAVHIVSHPFKGPLRTSALRGLGAYGNVFALESFMDELATAAGEDPVAFRLRHLKDERARAVVQAVAKKVNWDAKPAKHGLGFAFAQYKNQAAYFAVVAEVAFDAPRQELRVLRLVGVIDAGQAINPDGLKNQTEGGMIQSASWTTLEQVKFDRSTVTSLDWDTYPIFRFPQVPHVEVEVIDRPALPPLGAGEAAQGPTAAAIANAVFQLTGKRVRDLPITGEKISNS